MAVSAPTSRHGKGLTPPRFYPNGEPVFQLHLNGSKAIVAICSAYTVAPIVRAGYPPERRTGRGIVPVQRIPTRRANNKIQGFCFLISRRLMIANDSKIKSVGGAMHLLTLIFDN